MGLDRVTREQLMNGNWYASVKGQLFDESDFHIISHDEYMKIPIIKVISCLLYTSPSPRDS